MAPHCLLLARTSRAVFVSPCYLAFDSRSDINMRTDPGKFSPKFKKGAIIGFGGDELEVWTRVDEVIQIVSF